MRSLTQALDAWRAKGCAETGRWPHEWELDPVTCERCLDEFCQVLCRRCGAVDNECTGAMRRGGDE